MCACRYYYCFRCCCCRLCCYIIGEFSGCLRGTPGGPSAAVQLLLSHLKRLSKRVPDPLEEYGQPWCIDETSAAAAAAAEVASTEGAACNMVLLSVAKVAAANPREKQQALRAIRTFIDHPDLEMQARACELVA